MHLASCTVKVDGKRAWFIFFLFFYLYMPIVCSIYSAYLVGIVGCIFCLTYKKMRKEILMVAIILLFESLYIITLSFIDTQMITNTVGNIIYLVSFTLPGGLFLIHIAKQLQYGLDDMIENVAITATIQAMLSALCYFSGEFRNLLLVGMGYDLNAPELADIFKVRLYGYAIGLTYAMPILQAIIGTITLLYALMKRQKTKYIFMAILIWLSGIINGRTAFVVIALGIATAISLVGKIPITNIRRILVMASAGILLAIYGISRFGEKNNLMWLWDGLTELFAFMTRKQYKRGEYFDALYSSDFLKLPHGIGFFLGTGKYPNSDVGFVRNLWRDGLFFTIVIYGVLFYFILRIYKMVVRTYGKKIAKRIFAFSISTWILINIKGEAFGISEFFNLIVLFYAMSYYVEYKDSLLSSYREFEDVDELLPD